MTQITHSTVQIPTPDESPRPATSVPCDNATPVPCGNATPTRTTSDQATITLSKRSLDETHFPTVKTEPSQVTSKGAELGRDDKHGDNNKEIEKEPGLQMTFPDGGFGWAVVFGAFMIQFW
jgi:hypothetical protein